MFNLDALDNLIAVVVALLVLSLIVQSIQAAIKKFFHIKSLQLEQSLIHLFYYLLDKDAIKSMRSVSDRAPLLRAFFGAPVVRTFVPGHAKPILDRDPQVEDLYHAVTEEFVRAGRVSSRGKTLIESVSKDELIKFIGQVRASELIKHILLPERENISKIKDEIATARKAANVSLYTALGFSGPRWIVDAWKNPQWPTATKTIETVAGWLITTMLLSVGAPFWQDTLESLFGLKNFLRKKDPANT